MDDIEFDKAVIAAVFTEAGLVGWQSTSMVAAARGAGLDLARTRARFPGKTAVLLRFGSLADQATLGGVPAEGTSREKLFDLVMLRFDQLQAHRPGIMALIQALRTDPGTAVLLGMATSRSMRWLLEAAEVPTEGLAGVLRVQGLMAIWTSCLRAWENDDSADLSATMAALDRGLDRAVRAEDLLPGRRRPVADTPPLVSGTDVATAPDGPAVL